MHPKATEYANLAERAAVIRYPNDPTRAAQFEAGYLRGVLDTLCRDNDQMHACLAAAHERLLVRRAEETAEVA